MIVRLALLVLLAVALVTGNGPGAASMAEQTAGLVELEVDEATITEVVVLDACVASAAPPLVQGTEVEHASPELQRVFRPPRGALVRIA